MRKAILIFAGAIMASAWLLAESTAPANAYVYYPWCARYGGSGAPGVPICGFTTYAQCKATLAGGRDYCEQNWPPPSAVHVPQRRRL